MEVFRLLQIGDVHFPDPENSTAPIDRKDLGFPGRIASGIGQPPLQAVCRRLTRVIETQDPDVIAFMGDYTDRGNQTELAAGAAYLFRQLPPAWAAKISSHSVTCIGNHDIERATAANAKTRFDNVNTILTGAGFPAACIDQPTRINWTRSLAEIVVHGLNSCVGCGETRFLPSIIKPAVVAALADLISKSASPDLLNELIESIDTPAIDESAIADLLNAIDATSKKTLNIVCAHHNIFPQNTPRVAPYAELINAGSFRNSLLSAQRPIVFLHGHIHQDPCEILRSAKKRRAAIISISAPVLRDGFNMLEFAANNKGTPLGVRIKQFRRMGNQIEESSTLEVPFWPTLEGLSHATRESREMIERLPSSSIAYSSDLMRKSGLPQDAFENTMHELRWLGIIEVQNPESSLDEWRVTRAI